MRYSGAMRWLLPLLLAVGCNRPFDAEAPRSEMPLPVEQAAAAPACELEAAPARVIQHVIIVSEDGLRPDAISPERTPNHVAMMRAGTTARVADTVVPSETLPAHASMLSGYPPSVHKMVWDRLDAAKGNIDVPTLFSIAHEHGLTTAMFIGKPKLEHLAQPGIDHFERPGFFCKTVGAAANRYLVEHRPGVMFVHFADPDDAGHGSGWMSRRYLRAAEHSDACLGELLAAVDEAGIADSTLIIVTADHGGHNRTHSGARRLVSDRHIPWIARGPGVPADAWLEDTVTTYDTAVTALAALGLPASSDMAGVARLEFP